jgi:hypothetical protein
MQGGRAVLLAVIVVIVILVVAAYVWYHHTGWASFSYQTGDAPFWLPADGADLSRLRFKDVTFTVTRTGQPTTRDVTAVLNGMAVAFTGGVSNPPSLTLVRPLNPFSFVIPGFNDRASVPDPTAAPWCSAPPASCTKDSDCPSAVAGACGPNGTCFSCPGGATATLVGRWRTI